MLSNRDLARTTRPAKINWLLLVVIITVLSAGATNGARTQPTINSKNSSIEIGVQDINTKQGDSSSPLTALEVKEEPYTSAWTVMYDWWNWMIGGYAQNNNNNAVGEPRTFGAIRRLQLAIIPIVFKLGIVFAMITALVFLAMKTVVLLKILLVMNAAAIFAKLLLAKSEARYQPPPPWIGYGGWGHSPVSNWPLEQPLNKEVHLHIHGSNLAHPTFDRNDYGYTGTGATGEAANELNNRGPLPYYRSSQKRKNTYTLL